MSDWDVVQEVLENRYSFPIGKAEAALDRLRKEHDALKAHNAAGVDLLDRLREAEAYKRAWERLYEDGPSGRDVHDRLALERKTMMDTLLAEEMEKLDSDDGHFHDIGCVQKAILSVLREIEAYWC